MHIRQAGAVGIRELCQFMDDLERDAQAVQVRAALTIDANNGPTAGQPVQDAQASDVQPCRMSLLCRRISQRV